MKYEIKFTSRFKKDYKLAQKRGLDLSALDHVIEEIAEGHPLPAANKDHLLQGDYHGCRECHIHPDWLLIYKVFDSILVLELIRTGTHGELFR